MEDDGGRRWLGWETALGGLLLLLGIVVLLGQAPELELGRAGWPFFVIIPGLGLLGLAAPGRLGEVLATVGGVVTIDHAQSTPQHRSCCRERGCLRREVSEAERRVLPKGLAVLRCLPLLLASRCSRSDGSGP